MTNTHITIGGHKVTTNKVGQVHTITPISGSNVTGKIAYCVTNGICVISLYNTAATNTGNRKVGDVPKSKMGQMGGTIFTRGTPVAYWYVNGSGELFADYFVSNSGVFGEIVYPVADDWVES